MLHLSNVKKSYKEPGGNVLPILDIADFCIAAGEQMVLVGRSGSGKTTLLHVIGGITRPDEGTVEIDGTNITRLRVTGSQIDSPSWNPNPQISDLIAYTASEGGNRFQVFVYSLTTRQSIKLTSGSMCRLLRGTRALPRASRSRGFSPRRTMSYPCRASRHINGPRSPAP